MNMTVRASITIITIAYLMRSGTLSLRYPPVFLQRQSQLFLRPADSPQHSEPVREPLNTSRNDDHIAKEIGIGIDLGTTFSAVAYLKDGKFPTIIPVPENGRTMPSLVSINEQGVATVGKEAEAAQCPNMKPYRNVKRVLGTGGKLPKRTTKVIPFLRPSTAGKTFVKDSLANQIADAQANPVMLVSQFNSSELIRPEIISSHVLQSLKHVAEVHTGCKVTRAVIGVPAYFHDEQREATKRSAQMAGIEKVKLLREPEAAALAYGIGKDQVTNYHKEKAGDDIDDELVLVFDLGGGTFDVSMLLVGGGLTEIICTSGNAQLGGSDFDARIADHFRRLLVSHGISTDKWSEEGSSAIIQAAERVRIHLSNNKRVSLALPFEERGWSQMESLDDIISSSTPEHPHIDESTRSRNNNSNHLLCVLTRREVEVLCAEELQALLRPVREVAIMAGALLPGDTSPNLVEAAFEMGEAENTPQLVFEDFYLADSDKEWEADVVNSDELLLRIQESDMKATKKAQQRGRKKARDVAKQERKYRQEKRKIGVLDSRRVSGDGVKVRDGIAGRPISRVVLVGGATRMPAVGRLVAALTGTTPQKTINPDEAVALGCAVHVGTLDGAEAMGTVLNPMQAAILKAMALRQGIGLEDS